MADGGLNLSLVLLVGENEICKLLLLGLSHELAVLLARLWQEAARA